ncbi:MAG: ATP-binding protein [Myxococcota bacterium]
MIKQPWRGVKQIAVTFESTVGAEYGAEVDPVLIERVILNILANALKFTSAGGAIHTKLKVCTDTLEIATTDSGIGIAPEECRASSKDFIRPMDQYPTTRRYRDWSGVGARVG